jgi:hypothetical protein
MDRTISVRIFFSVIVEAKAAAFTLYTWQVSI